MRMLRWSLPLLMLVAAVAPATAAPIIDNDEIYCWGDPFGDRFDYYAEAAPGDTIALEIWVNDLDGSYDMTFDPPEQLVNETWQRATDGAGGEAGPGGSLSAASATLHVRVLAPSWMDVDSVEVFGPGCAPVASHAVEPGASAPVWFEGEIPVQPEGDAYYFVEVRGTDPMDPVWPDAIPSAITNPVFIDSP